MDMKSWSIGETGLKVTCSADPKTPGVWLELGSFMVTAYFDQAQGLVLGLYKDKNKAFACDLALSYKDSQLNLQYKKDGHPVVKHIA
jgi:hypothetical protein